MRHIKRESVHLHALCATLLLSPRKIVAKQASAPAIVSG
uniref:Uncharacterized protein n=1 Tax=Anopheles atroparvus TaxID=41427 RepID=A0AAG5DHB5_ANOAO